VKNAGSPCRTSLQECDLPEYCTGKSEYCPLDLYKLDGTLCGQEKVCLTFSNLFFFFGFFLVFFVFFFGDDFTWFYNPKAYCYEGSCRTHSDQCRLLWGPSGKGSDAKCYDQNTHGNKTGNCGYLKVNDTFTKCLDE
jgi:hypothetical protein